MGVGGWWSFSADLLETKSLSFYLSKKIRLCFLNYFVFHWRMIVLQCCIGFCHFSTWVSRRYTCGASLLRLPPPQVVAELQAARSLSYGRFPLAICFTRANMYVSVLLSQSSHPLLAPPAGHPWVSHSLRLRLVPSFLQNILARHRWRGQQGLLLSAP